MQENRDKLWGLEDKSIPEYLNLPNTSPHTPLTDRVLFESEPVKPTCGDQSTEQLTHQEILTRQNLAEFSDVSHTAVYLHDKLSKLGKFSVDRS